PSGGNAGVPVHVHANSRCQMIPEPGRYHAVVASQLDYAFASRGFHKPVTTTTLNKPEEWGPSDHCQIEVAIT
ncbi:MAG: hypothetical protein OXI37_03020, partial [Gammaproteobacteria bacterium]|nr:hypothetical protein [Gammaproteobacteria bacterium]